MNVLSSLVLVAVLAQARPAPPPGPEQEKKTSPATQGAKPRLAICRRATDGLALQVALDRAGFSPGAIDGQAGSSTKKALEAYRKQNGGDPAPVEPTDPVPRSRAEDAAGPFEPQIPTELPDQAKLPALSYKTVVEALAERFHSTPEFLKKLNPDATFASGEQIIVPNVEPMQLPTKADAAKANAKADTAKPRSRRARRPGTRGNGRSGQPIPQGTSW